MHASAKRAGYILLGFLGFALLVAPWIRSSDESNWPQWRGPGAAGVSKDENFPTEWSTTKNVLWRTAIPGLGHSSPIVWEDRIFLTSSLDGEIVPGHSAVKHYRNGEEYVHPDATGAERSHTLLVLCIDRKTGDILWQREAYEGTVYDDHHRRNTYASGTPVTDGKVVYAFFDAEGLYCYDFEGELVWKKSLGPIAKGGMGYGMSPVLYENLIILQCDQEYGEGSFIAALDRRTGETVWRVPRSHRRSWATPLLAHTNGHAELVASGAESVIAYDPTNGEELWRCRGVISHPIPSPVSAFGMVFLSAGSGAKHAFAVRLGGSGGLNGTSHIAWEYNKGTSYVASPIVYGNYIYLLTNAGLVTCIEARTGEVVYADGRVPTATTFRSSPVAFDDKILLSSEDGDTFILKAGPKHEILGTNSIGEPIWASPALSRGQIFIRGQKHLYCIAKMN
jgi:outer membrane protein assembly factor BamB